MGNPEHLEILKQGVDVWNRWRRENYEIRIELKGADFVDANLAEFDLSRVNLQESNLCGANLTDSSLRASTMTDCNLEGANLSRTDLSDANLSRANLRKSIMIVTILLDTNLNETDFSEATIGWCSFGNVDLSNTQGLGNTNHTGPSYIDFHTIYRSRNNISEKFLRGAGIPENFIEYMPSLISIPFAYYSCFISYSSKDQNFAERLYADLQNKGVRCWFAPEDIKIGDKIRQRIDDSIRSHDKLLLVLSEQSINSKWVEKEVETAFERETPSKTVLFPVRLDDAVIETDQAWAADIRRTRHIGDFTKWKTHDEYQKAFERLLRDLKAES